MINLALSVLVLLAGTALISTQHKFLANLRMGNEELRRQLQDLGVQQDLLRQRRAGTETELKQQLENVQATLDGSPVNPEEFPEVLRGERWTEDREYFFLRKSALSHVMFSPFRANMEPNYGHGLLFNGSPEVNQPSGSSRDPILTDTPAYLFGINQLERDAIDDAYGKAGRRFVELTCGRIERCPNPVEDGALAQLSLPCYRIPACSGEEGEAVQQFTDAVRSILGGERGDLFAAKTAPILEKSFRSLRAQNIYIWWAGQIEGSWEAFEDPGSGGVGRSGRMGWTKPFAGCFP